MNIVPKTSAIIVALLASAALFAAEVSEVIFVQPQGAGVPEAGLAARVKTKVHAPFDRKTLDDDVKRLYAAGSFSDIVAESDIGEDGSVKVTFRLRLKPRIVSLDFAGNARFPTHELAKDLSLRVGSLMNDKDLQECAEKVRKFYFDRGYRDAEVVPVVIPKSDGIAVTFKITENSRLKVRDVTFEGATVFSQWTLRHEIVNQYSYWNWLPFINDYLNFGLLDRAELKLDEARILDKYRELGYLDARILSCDVVTCDDAPDYVDIKFAIEEGEPYTVSDVTIAGTSKFSGEELLQRMAIKKGETYALSREQKSIKNLTSLYETMGYCDVSCQALKTENYENHTVDIEMVVTEGTPYTVRDVIIVGNTDTKDKVIRRELVIQPGDPVDRNRIDISRQRLMGMGYFKKVEADAVNADAVDEKDVRISVTENNERYHLRIGAGVSDVNSVFGMAEISTDNFDIFAPKKWFYGGGQRARIQGVIGLVNAGFNVDFVEPWLFDKPIRFELSSYMNTTEYESWDEVRIGARTSFQKKIFDDFTSLMAGYKFELVRVKGIRSRLEKYFDKHDLDGWSRVSQPFLSLTRDTRDSLVDPTEGYMINAFASVSPRILGSSSDYYRLELKGSYHTSFFDKAIVIMAGAKIGTVAPFNRNRPDDVPVFERYFLGGGDTIRGFDYRSVGPYYGKDNIGGQTMLLLTAEVSHPIWGPIRGAVFVDAGNTWANSWSMNFSQFCIGVGYGLRIKLPTLNVPIKLDLAYPILKTSDQSGKLRIHFNVGFSF